MESAEIARRFLTYFSDRGHTVVPSASLIAEDPTLLLVNAGMQPFKPYFLGQASPPFQRATSAQKCVRTPDIEEVGRTTRHGTFFQMLGNFSFGDYFKEQAIPFAWELLTTPERDGGFGFPEERLWATVYHDDDEAFRIWRDTVGVPESRIQRRGMADNFWSMGVPGPCGPCSEIYYDRGPDYGRDGGPIADEDRYLEVWNLVFMQFLRGEGAGKEGWPILGELPSRNIDTGMGLERMAAILQGVDNIYEIDTLWKILDRAAELTEQKYGRDHRGDVALRVVADHVRTAVMLVSDGVLPSNEGRGYVLRRILRRSIYNLRLLAGGQRGGGSDGRYLHELADTAISAMADQFPELRIEAPRILGVIDAEESTFLSTLRTGSAIFDAAVGETKRRGTTSLSGDQAFQLHDTYGFPIDLTLEMASEQGLTVDEEGFRRLMAQQRQRAKQDSLEKKTGNADISVFASLLAKSGPVRFTGYDEISGEATVAGLLAGGVSVPAAGAGTEVEVILDRTPFYAEGGGQLADTGLIRVASAPGAAGGEVEVRDVQAPVPGLIVHRGVITSGEVVVGALAEAIVDTGRRRAISRSHTATHMVHRAIRGALGDSAAQAGSENSPGWLALRLHGRRGRPADRAPRRGGRGQPGAHRRPRGPRLRHPHRRGAVHGSHRPVRGEVRRRGPRGRGRELLTGTVRRHPRGALRAARADQDPRGVLHRFRRAPGRGPGRDRRIPLPRPGERAGQPADRAAEDPPGGPARPGRLAGQPGSGRPSATWTGCAAPRSSAARPSWPDGPRTPARSRSSPTRSRTAPPRTTSASSPWISGAGSRSSGPQSW